MKKIRVYLVVLLFSFIFTLNQNTVYYEPTGENDDWERVEIPVYTKYKDSSDLPTEITEVYLCWFNIVINTYIL